MFCTIIIPSIYRESLYLTLESLKNQSNQDFCVILVNDSVKSLCFEDEWFQNKVTILEGPRTGWGGPARNIGIQYVKKYNLSEWIGFVDDDDYLHPQYIEWLKEHSIKSPHADIIVFRARGGFAHIPPTYIIPPPNCYQLVLGMVTNSFAFKAQNCFEFNDGIADDFFYLENALKSKSKIIMFSNHLAYGYRMPIYNEVKNLPLVQLT